MSDSKPNKSDNKSHESNINTQSNATGKHDCKLKNNSQNDAANSNYLRRSSSSYIETKKIPPIKAPVGIAPPPQIKKAKSKVGSLDNVKHKPGGGKKKIFNQPKVYESVQSKVGSKDNIHHTPGGGKSKIFSAKRSSSTSIETSMNRPSSASTEATVNRQSSASIETSVDNLVGNRSSTISSVALSKNNKAVPKSGKALSLDNQKSKVGSLDNINHKPTGGEKQIEKLALDWEGTSKVGSLDNISHQPGGGTKKISSEKLQFKKEAKSKVGSLDNINHKPGGGNAVIKTYPYSK